MQEAKFKRKRMLRAVVALICAVALAGCAQSPTRPGDNARMQQPLAKLELPANPAQQDAAALTLAAEFALQHNDIKTAAADYAQAAMLTSDPRIAQRAVELNLAVRDETRVGALIARWQVLGAAADALAGARAQLAMLQGNRDEAQQQFARMLAANTLDDWREFGRALSEVRDPALAGVMLESLAQPQRLPADQKLWVAFSQLGEKLGRHAYAQKLADAATRRFGGGPSLLWDAQLKMAGGDRAGAKAVLARALQKNPQDTQLRLDYAALLDAEHDDAGAQRVLAEGPQDAQTWSARVAYAARARDMPLLERLYAQLKRAPADVRDDSVFLLGQLAELLKKDDEALQWYARVPGEDEHAFDAQARSAVLTDKAGHAQQAHEAAQRLQQDYVGDPEHLRRAYQLDAELYARDKRYAQAADAYRRGLHALPDDTELLYGLGLAEAEDGKTDAAIADLRRVLALKPDDVDAMNALGYTLADSDQHLDEAARLLAKALTAKPDEPAIMDSWGWLQYRLGHLEIAERALRSAWNKSRDPEIGVHLGEVLWMHGQRDQARDVFAQVRKLDPDNKALRGATERLHP